MPRTEVIERTVPNAESQPGDPDPIQDWQQWLSAPLRLQQAANEYLTDAWQRAILYADVRRQRGNQYLASVETNAPNVLNFAYETVMTGASLERPTNYWLGRIIPQEGMPVDDSRRPFIVVDPRAGHGPGIGGFKPDSEIGAALKAGHPCYFVGFLAEPVRGQTVEDVMHTEAAFLRRVGELHPDSNGKPTVVANCQAGWQILMTAAIWPELFGPIIIAGTPVSYWAGNTPMRLTGGLLGGSWLTAMTSDLGDGRFDGAWLIQNFEGLDPANTLWKKQYHVYANVDTEGSRYLEFEKYWGGLVYLEGDEIQYIVDKLFIGNKLSTGQLTTSDGVRIDLRNIKSPIVVFCSYGDNITPPGQALGWITDLYQDDEQVQERDQTIIYATHETIGHLGIFVSGNVGKKEHAEFAANIDMLDLLPPGIYQAEIEDAGHQAGDDDPYLTRIRRSSVAEVREIVGQDLESERRFAAAAAVSQANLALYRQFVQPWVQALAASPARHWLQECLPIQNQPLRRGFERWSDRHPLAASISEAAEQVRLHRRPASADNPFIQLQEQFSEGLTQWLDQYRDQRDAFKARWFDAIYGSSVVQALAGIAQDGPAVRQPAPDSETFRAHAALELQSQQAALVEGGLAEAALRSLLYVLQARGQADERRFRDVLGWLRMLPGQAELSQPQWRALIQQQGVLVRRDPAAAIAALPALLTRSSSRERAQVASALEELLARGDALTEVEQVRLDEVLAALAGDAAELQMPRAAPARRKAAAAAATPTTRGSRSTARAQSTSRASRRAKA